MENIGIYATKDIDINDIIKDTIKEVNESMSLICDNLVAEAEKSTNTLEEYNAFMKGAAFVFKCIAKRNDPTKYGTPSTISTIQSAIQHCIKLLPFMEEMADELTTGNVAHKKAAIKGFAGRAKEFLIKHT